jgi:penicillin-binding protein 1C
LDSALSYCLHCLPSTGKYFRKRYPNHPKELSNYWLQQGLNFQNVPPHNPICSKTNDDKGPEILGITDRSTYYFEKNQQGRLQLRCLPEKDVRKVYWYVNDKLLFVSEPHSSVFWKPSKGKFQISVADDRGRKNKIQIEVILF